MRKSTSSLCGTLLTVFRDCHYTETMAKPGRLGPAQNGTTSENFHRVLNVLIDYLEKSAQKTLSSVC